MVVCEVTGGYERPLVTRLRRTEITMHVAHPNRVHAFVKAYGYEPRPTRGTPRCSRDTDRSLRMH